MKKNKVTGETKRSDKSYMEKLIDQWKEVDGNDGIIYNNINNNRDNTLWGIELVRRVKRGIDI